MAPFSASAAQHTLSPISPAAAASSTPSAGGGPSGSAHPPLPPLSGLSIPPPTPGAGGVGYGYGPGAVGTPTQAGFGAQQPQHKRVYQACIPCRRRKVRCDLGSVDDPHDPPCVRCRRESKECFFSATRRKRKADDADHDEEVEHDDYILRNGRKQLRSAASPPAIDRRLYSEVPLTPGGSQGRSQPLRKPGDDRKSTSESIGPRSTATAEFSGEPNTPLENFEARNVMRREVYGPHDALDLLYKAATDNSPSHKQDENQTTVQGSARSNSIHNMPDLGSHQPSNANGAGGYHSRHASRHEPIPEYQSIDPELTKRHPTNEGHTEALKVWARFRFVRAGWFTAQEAIDYIDYYYKYLSPLTPISPPTFQAPASHGTLLTEEPILAVTLLTIASRYRRMPGTGGHCRSHAIHEQLWTYLRGMIERVVWGQEAFGGGFCGSGADETQNSSTAPWRGLRRGSLRTFGTIESLMILTEWHPRALHFPPSEAIDELLLPSYESQSLIDGDGHPRPSGAFGGRRIESWLEPAWRSDRMCWMLLTTGYGLAYELGVFDDIDEMLATGAITRPEYEEESYRLRANRIKRLLLIYLSQLAGRLGWTNMVPEKLRRSDPAISKRRPHSVEGTTPGTNPSSMSSNIFNYIPDLELDDQIIHCWAGITNAMQVGNDKLFRSRKHTRVIIQSGKYTDLLKEFTPMLRDWWSQFERFRMPPYIRHILTIEYEYVRIYINSLSLQAVVERCTTQAGGGADRSAPGGSVSGNSGPQLSPQTQNFYGKLPLGKLGGFSEEDKEYVREVVNGSRNLLRTVVKGLLPEGYLKHAPVRTYFRIISGAMFLLKTFALGAPKSDVEISISLMDETVDALRNCVVDDVHLGIRFADLLETLTSRLRNRFIHAPAQATEERSPAANGETTNGNGHVPAQDLWQKLGSGVAPERSATPANISATPWDMTGNFPYPSGPGSMFGPSTPAATTTAGPHEANGNGNGAAHGGLTADPNFFDTDWAPGNDMWYLPPGPAFFQNIDNTSVAMTAEGVNINGLDLLEYMGMDNEQFSMEGNGY